MTLADDLRAAKALIASGRTMTQAIDEVTGDSVRAARISNRSIAIVDCLNGVRPKRPGRPRPTLGEMDKANHREVNIALFDRAIAAAETAQ